MNTTHYKHLKEIENIGKNIYKYRTQKDLTQKELSSLTGIQRADISRHENNKRLLTLEMFIRYAKAFEITLDQLIED